MLGCSVPACSPIIKHITSSLLLFWPPAYTQLATPRIWFHLSTAVFGVSVHTYMYAPQVAKAGTDTVSLGSGNDKGLASMRL